MSRACLARTGCLPVRAILISGPQRYLDVPLGQRLRRSLTRPRGHRMPNPGDSHYCNNCRHHDILPDGVWCGFCRRYYNVHGRMPVRGDTLTTLELLIIRLEAMS